MVEPSRRLAAALQEANEASKELDRACRALVLELAQAREKVAEVRARQAAIRQECRDVEATLALAGEPA